MEDQLKRFLSVSSEYGRGDGSGYGSGYGNGYGRGYGSENGRGYGSGDGSGDGGGYGSGYGSEDGSGYGRGDGRGYGRGHGSGDGSGIKSYNGKPVYVIDGVQTMIDQVRGNVAKGKIVNADLTTTPCWIAKQDGRFAHGATLREARESLLEKLFDDMPEAERLSAFVQAHEPGKLYPNTDYFSWHHRLTGSCEMGRRQFARDHGIDVEHGSMTPEAFIRLTVTSFGGSTIAKLREFYPDT